MSLLSAAEHLAAIDRSAVVLNTEHCLYTQITGSDCQACYTICPVEAIQPGTPPSLDAEKCQTCLACLTVCPTGAFSADDAVPSLLTCASRIEDHAIEVMCGKHAASEEGVAPIGVQVRGCLAGLGTGSYMALAAIGIERIYLRMDACEDCPWAPLKSHIQEQSQMANQLYQAIDEVELVTCVHQVTESQERPLWSAANPPLSRRDLFRLAARQGKVALARAMLEQPAGKRKAGRDRLRANEAISHIRQENEPIHDVTLTQSNYATLTVSDKCSACQACVRACPTQCLHFEKEENYFRLKIRPQDCIACGNCTRVCLPQAIEVNQAPLFSQVYGQDNLTVLSEGNLIQCSHCKSWYAEQTGSDLCPLCDFRRQNPFGSVMPSSLRKKTKNSEKNVQ